MSKSAERPTPITDAEWQTQCCSGASWYRIAEKMKNRAADLERKLAEALEWKRMLSSWGGTPEIVDSFIKGQQERIAAAQEAEKQRDEWKELYERLNESLASNKRLFSSKLAEKVIDDQVKRIKFLEDKYSETQKELLKLKGGES